MPVCIRLFIAALLAIVVGVDLRAQPLVPLSLKDAVETALRNNADLIIAKARADQADYGVRESRGNLLPKLNLNGNYTRNIDKPVIFLPESFGMGGATKIGLDNNFSAYLDLSVPLYSRYNVSAQHYARSNLFLQQESKNGAEAVVVASVKKAYFACLLSMEAVRVREKALANAEQNHTNIVHKAALGVATEYDETAASVRVLNFRSDLLDASNQVGPAKNTMKLLLGLPLEAVIVLTDSLDLREEELNVFPNAAELVNNSNLRQKELMMQVARQQTDMARSSVFPVLSGTGTYQYQSQQNDFHFSNYNWVLSSSLGLRLQLPIFNGTVTRNKVQQSIINESIARTQKDYTTRYNDTQFEQLISRLDFLKQRIELQSGNIRLAARAVQLIGERYRYGKASLLEVNSTELDYVSARLNYLQSVVEYKSAYCDLELLTGK